MRFYVLFGVLVSLAQMPIDAQGTDCGRLGSLGISPTAACTISTSNLSIQGTWISQVTDATGNLALFEVGTFSANGAYSGANVNPSHTTHKGVWVRTGDRQFVLTVLFFTHDNNGVFNGIVKARIYLTLAEDLQSYDSVAERVVMDTASREISVTPGIKGHAVRMNVELPKTPQ
ncbi:MAG TPA: hypothetical protein VGZ73_28740 [Bryobacteraceae bacterium]|jgi:hypothetical protein|nr:hypothetical protein [Bryobacteraceae bacterium]